VIRDDCEIHRAVKENRPERVRALVQEDRRVLAQKDNFGQTALHHACWLGLYDIAAFLISSGAPVDERNRYSNTPLHLAAVMGHERIVKRLIAEKVSVNAANRDGSTPLHDAAKYGRAGIASMLINAGCDIDGREANSMDTPLILASKYGHHEIVRLLVDAGADLSLRNGNDETALSVAKNLGHPGIAGMLSEKDGSRPGPRGG